MNFFAILLEFSITRRAGTKRNVNFYSLFLILFQPILARNEAVWYFLNFWIFCYFFGIFYIASGRNETERYFLYSLFLGIFQSILAWNEAIVVFFHFFHFFAILLEFLITHRAGTKRNDNFYFLSFSSFSSQFWLEMKP